MLCLFFCQEPRKGDDIGLNRLSRATPIVRVMMKIWIVGPNHSKL